MRQPMNTSRRARWLVLSLGLAAVGVGAALLLRHGTGLWRPAQAPQADLMAAELLRADARADLCTAVNAIGAGLRGEYFADPLLRGAAALVRVDAGVDFDAASLRSPSGQAEPKVASVRWSGWIKPPLSGMYRFHADTPNMRVLVARNVVAGDGASGDGRVDLSAGRFYPIEVVVTQLGDGAAPIRLEWTAPHGARYLVPRALLHLPTETVATTRPPTGSAVSSGQSTGQ